MKFSHVMLTLVAIGLAITMLISSHEHGRMSRLENAVKIMTSPDYENLNRFTEQMRTKLLELYNEMAELRSQNDTDELKELQLSSEKLRTLFTETNHRFRREVAATGKNELLNDYYHEIWPLSQNMCDIGNKLGDYKKQHPK